ncbi:MAG TPA: ABC transporter permease [Thermoanaerobaculia bacterium]
MIRDFRQSARQLARQPAQALAAVLALALGIGLTTAMFSIIDGSLLRGLPWKGAERLVRVTRGSLAGGILPAEIAAWGERQASFSALVPWFAVDEVFRGDGRPAESLHGAYVSAPFFRAVGVAPVLGRGFLPEDDRERAPKVVVLGADLWRRRYQSDPRVLGRLVYVGGDPATVVGVMPKGFKFPLDQDYWLAIGPVLRSVSLNHIPLDLFGRLREGVSLAGAQGELDSLAAGVPRPEQEAVRTLVRPFAEAYTESARKPLWLLMGAVTGVLLIACTNVANLLLAWGGFRERDLAVRAALGAGSRRLASPVLAEALLVSALGAAAGLAVAQVCLRLYNAAGGLVQSFWVDIRLDSRALAFTTVVTLGAALLAGSLPALRVSRMDPGRTLQERQSQGGMDRRLGRWGKGLVVVQVALSCALLGGTWQMIASVRNLYRNDFGDSPERVWTALVVLDTDRLASPDEWSRLYGELQRELEAIPGVRAAALASHLPATPTPRAAVAVEGLAGPANGAAATARWSVISPGYFASLGRSVLEGRDFAASDLAASLPVALVNRSFAARYFPHDSLVGRRIRLRDPKLQQAWMTIVGVVPDLYLSWDYFSDRVDLDHPEGIYLPLAQHPRPGIYYEIRSSLPSRSLELETRKVLARLDPEIPPLQEQRLSDRIAAAFSDYRMMRSLFSVFGLASLALAGIGIYGVVAFVAGQRTREVAIRMALGARPLDVVRILWLRGGAVQVGLGVVIGLGLAASLSRLLKSVLFGVVPGDPGSLIVAALSLLVAAVVACLVPARRAVRIDPMVILRDE